LLGFGVGVQGHTALSWPVRPSKDSIDSTWTTDCWIKKYYGCCECSF